MEFRDHHDPRGGHVFTSIGSGSRPTRTTRSWTSNGVNYTVDTTSFSSPGISFGAMTGSANGPFRSFTAPIRSSGRSASNGGGLLGNAFGLLEDLLTLPQPRQEHFADQSGQSSPNGRRVHVEVESDTDDDLIYEDYEEDHSRSKSMFSKIKDRLRDAKHKPRNGNGIEYGNSRDHSHSRERSPVRRPRPERRQSPFRTEVREPQWSQTRRRPQSEFIEVDYHDDDDEPVYVGEQNRRPSQVDANMIEALGNAVELERRSVRACKKRLEQATRQPAISSHHLQRLLNELKGHEKALTNAQASLDEARAKQRSAKFPPRTSSHLPRPPQQRQSSRSLEEEFFSPFAPGFSPFFTNARSAHPRQNNPVFQAFEEMNSFDPFSRAGGFGFPEQIFEQMRASAAADDGHFGLFTTGGGQPHTSRKRTRYSMPPNSGPQFQQSAPGFTNFTAPPPPQPPANLFKPEEAKRLFKTYNDRWNALPAHDANVPYPARGLQANALAARDSIWAPQCNTSVSTWSDETVLQANAQAFYLGVVGLTPKYTESPATGRVEMGFDKSKASPQQIKELVDLLKKERNRWHSDRLGRRNGGLSGPNEALQKDERARAVFHAVCELMESAQ